MRVNFKEFDSNRKFGVELEVSATKTREEIRDIILSHDIFHDTHATTGTGSYGWSDTRDNDYWHVKYDSTCGPLGKKKDHGWEIASYIASGIDDIENISSLARYLNKEGLEVNDNCGLHIHVEVKDFSTRDMGALLARWIKVEPWLFSACAARRQKSIYCRPMTQRQQDKCSFYHSELPEQFWYDMMPTNTSTHNNNEKKFSLNTVGYAVRMMHPLYDRSTVELRLPECLLDKDHVKNWIVLFVNFVETCSHSIFAPQNTDRCENIQDVLDVLGLGKTPNGTFQILDHELFGAKTWFLKKLISHADGSLKEQAQEHLEFISRL